MRYMLDFKERKIQSINSKKLADIIEKKLYDIFDQEAYEKFIKVNGDISFETFLKFGMDRCEIKHSKSYLIFKFKKPNIGSYFNKEKTLELLKWFLYDIEKYGWFISNSTFGGSIDVPPNIVDPEEVLFYYSDSNPAFKFTLEPFYGIPIEDVPKYTYHLSRPYNVESILKKGLVPKSERKQSMYPPRVYVLLSLDRINDLILGFIENEYPMSDIVMGGTKIPDTEKQENFVELLRIDTNMLRKGTKFFKDPNMPTGAWTYTHIPAEAIELMDINKYTHDRST